MRRLPAERINEMWDLYTGRLPLSASLADTFFPLEAGRVLPGQIMRALAARAEPMSAYTHPPQEPPAPRIGPLAYFCRDHGCPCADDCSGQPCHLLRG